MKISVENFADFAKKAAALSKVAEKLKPLAEQFLNSLNNLFDGLTFGEEVDTLDVQGIVTFSKKYMVNGSNEVAAMKEERIDEKIVYLSYLRDGELIPKSANHYVIIKAKSFALDVEGLFKDSNLVILK